MTSEVRTCQNCQSEFTVEPEDFEFYEKVEVPAPTWCPMCRAQRRIAWRNERGLYKRVCDRTGKEIFSMYHPDTPVTVVDNDYWWGDEWDGFEYGKDIDWDRPLLEQFHELEVKVPRPSRSVLNLENSDYSNNASALKDCYLTFNSVRSEKIMYGTGIHDSQDDIDNNYLFSCELCYGCVMCRKCYGCHYCIDCENSHELIFCKDVIGSSNCVGCVNLRNSKYCIFNEQLSQAEYEKRVQEMHLDTREGVANLRKQFLGFITKFPVKYIHENNSENSTGEYLYNTSNVHESFFMVDSENCKYCQLGTVPTVKDSYDYSVWGQNSELIYECAACGNNISRIKFSDFIFPNSSEMEYAMFCTSSNNLFMCAGLKKAQYCILNKQYTKEEYEKLLPKLKQHMNDMTYNGVGGLTYTYGEFFPPEFLPYGYNHTLAYEFFPLTKEEAEKKGYSWLDSEERSYKTTVTASDLPQSIRDVQDTILQEVIGCEHEGKCTQNCTSAFKILPKELAFYRKYNIPLPHLCPNCRHGERIVWRNPIQLHERACQCAGEKSENGKYKNTVAHDHKDRHCPRAFKTAYSPQRPEIVYCKECYNSEVI